MLNNSNSNGTSTLRPSTSFQSIGRKATESIANQVSCGYDYTALIDANGNLYAWGYNGFGQLGDGTVENKNVPTKINLPNGVKAKQVSCSDYHTAMIDTEGNLYTWGNNKYGQLGDGTTRDTNVPTKINLPNNTKASQISCDFYNTIVVDTDGNLYACGSNKHGQLGDEIRDSMGVAKKINLSNGIKISQVSCSDYHIVVIDTNGNMYTYGRNSIGQLGDGTTEDRHTLTKINLPNGVKVEEVSCSFYNTGIIGNDGNLYICDHETRNSIGVPIKINLPNGVKAKQISCGYHHTALIDTDGNLYTWGWNNYGQLGDGTTIDKHTPTKINLPNGVKASQVSCGFYHTIVIDTDGNMYSCGTNLHGELGNRTTKEKHEFTKINLYKGLEKF